LSPGLARELSETHQKAGSVHLQESVFSWQASDYFDEIKHGGKRK